MGAQFTDRPELHRAVRQLGFDRTVGVERVRHAIDHAGFEDRAGRFDCGWGGGFLKPGLDRRADRCRRRGCRCSCGGGRWRSPGSPSRQNISAGSPHPAERLGWEELRAASSDRDCRLAAKPDAADLNRKSRREAFAVSAAAPPSRSSGVSLGLQHRLGTRTTCMRRLMVSVG